MSDSTVTWGRDGDAWVTDDGWRLEFCQTPPPNRDDFGPGWYLSGPDVVALKVGRNLNEALAGGGPQVLAWRAVRRAAE